MRILGIDPGTIRMGYGLIDDQGEVSAIDWGAVSLSRSLPLETRLFQMYSHLLNMISIWHPDAIAVEEPFVGKNEARYVGPALAVGQAQATAFIAAAGQSIPLYRYTPAQVKRSVADYGAASKGQIQEMVKLILRLDTMPEPSDASDALAIALCHVRQKDVLDLAKREIKP